MQSPRGLIAEMYLTDSLLNGAGYANYFLRDDAHLKELLDEMRATEDRLEGHQAPGTAVSCDSSCYASSATIRTAGSTRSSIGGSLSTSQGCCAGRGIQPRG